MENSRPIRSASPFVVPLSVGSWLLLSIMVLSACGGGRGPAGGAAGDTVTVVFTYSSEKEDWIEDMVERFNARDVRTADGRLVQVRSLPMSSEECIAEILQERRRTTVTSPASVVPLDRGNIRSLAETGRPLFGDSQSLVGAPTVIAMWKPMAEALGWGTRPVRWADLLALAGDPRGWGAYGHPEWGLFKFGHTHPFYANSGLAAILSVAYAASGKSDDFSLEDARSPEVAAALRTLGASVVQYGASTGFFGRKIVERGPSFLHAAVLYSNVVDFASDQVIQADADSEVVPLVAVTPEEGIFMNEHPCAVVEREWVSPEEREGARLLIAFLLAEPQQRASFDYGFVPADPEVALERGAAADGTAEPARILPRPSLDVQQALLEAWRENRKANHVVFVVDRSGHDAATGRQRTAREILGHLLSSLGPHDTVSLLAFGDTLAWIEKDRGVAAGRDSILASLDASPEITGGNAVLYDAVATAARFGRERQAPDRFVHVVLISTCDNAGGTTIFSKLLMDLHTMGQPVRLRVFTIGIGPDVNEFSLGRIAKVSHALSKLCDRFSPEILADIEAYF